MLFTVNEDSAGPYSCSWEPHRCFGKQLMLGDLPGFGGGQWAASSSSHLQTHIPALRLQVLLAKCHLASPSLPCSCSPPPTETDQQKPRELGNMAPAQHGPHQHGTTVQGGLCLGDMLITSQSLGALPEVRVCHECCWRDTFSQWVINN